MYFHVFIAPYNYSHALKKKITQLISKGVFKFSYSLYSVINVQSLWSTFFYLRSRGILGFLTLIFLELSCGVKGVLAFL